METRAGRVCPLCGAPARFVRNTERGRLHECTSCGEEDSQGNMLYSEFEVKLQIENSFE